MSELRWGYCERCQRWILSNRWRRSKCPLCARSVHVLEKPTDGGFYLELDILVPGEEN